MKEIRPPLKPKETLRLILLPMLGTFLVMRLYLHLVKVQHVYPGGYLVHHLFTGAVLVIVAAFVIAFDPPRRRTAVLARIALGIGGALVLDELVFLVMTKASDEDYISPLSLYGGAGFTAAAAVLLWALHRSARKRDHAGSADERD